MTLRSHPTPKWIRGWKGAEVVVDSRRALVVWREPGPPYPIGYAFPPADVRSVETTPFDDRVLIEWDAVDQWLEDDEPLVGHIRDPFRRIDVRPSSRHVVIEHEGELLADSRRPWVLYETGLPARFYLPGDDVRLDRLQPSSTRTTCAYKGHAAHFAHGGADVAWVYRNPLFDAPPVKDRIAFYDERVDVTIDGERQERPQTMWSPRPTGD